jgi:hypothetical protein
LAQADYQCAFRAEILSVGCLENRRWFGAAGDRSSALVAHLQRKFSELLARYPAEAMRFGRPVTTRIQHPASGRAESRPHGVFRRLGAPPPVVGIEPVHAGRLGE